jgi:hypothetical protein
MKGRSGGIIIAGLAVIGVTMLIGCQTSDQKASDASTSPSPSGPASLASEPSCNPASYVKEVRVEPEGEDGLAVYVRLFDAGNNDTCAEGTVTINLYGYNGNDSENASLIYSLDFHNVRADNFSQWEVTNSLTGSTTHKLAWKSPRVVYSEIQPVASGGPDSARVNNIVDFLRLLAGDNSSVRKRAYAEVVFTTTDGQQLRGKSEAGGDGFTFETLPPVATPTPQPTPFVAPTPEPAPAPVVAPLPPPPPSPPAITLTPAAELYQVVADSPLTSQPHGAGDQVGTIHGGKYVKVTGKGDGFYLVALKSGISGYVDADDLVFVRHLY